MHRVARFFAAAALMAAQLGAIACNDFWRSPSEPGASAPPIDGAVQYVPPDIYTVWWEDVLRCSGRTRDFAGVSWFMVPDVTSFQVGEGSYGGYWWPARKILIAGAWTEHAQLVRHEMLHDVLRMGSHPAEYFNERCEGVVLPYFGSQQSGVPGGVLPRVSLSCGATIALPARSD